MSSELDEQRSFERDVAARLRHLAKTARMWGSPEELETVAQHLSHVWLASRTPGWTFAQTFEVWKGHGTPLAGDADAHAAMRVKLWAADEERARVQVVQGYVVVWTQLERTASREVRLGPWIDELLDRPAQVSKPDLLDMVLFALMGFVAKEPPRYVELLSLERQRVGGHELRPLHVVGPPGPSEAALTWTRHFTTWARVVEGITAVVERLESGASPG